MESERVLDSLKLVVDLLFWKHRTRRRSCGFQRILLSSVPTHHILHTQRSGGLHPAGALLNDQRVLFIVFFSTRFIDLNDCLKIEGNAQ